MQPLPMKTMYKLKSYTMPPLTTHDTTWCLHHQHAACSMQTHHKNAYEAWHGPTKMNTDTKTQLKYYQYTLHTDQTPNGLQGAAEPGSVE